MATKFSSIYKQELKSKGVLSSMGSAVLKSARERMDVRNMFFGGKGMLSATGQKVFGRGYSALSSGAGASPSAAQAAAQSSATSDLLASSERQEALLRVVAKNTFNMNLMARDMNITRQNIATLTRLAAGKAAQSQDALWYDVKTRNQSIDSLGKKTPTKATGNTQSSGSGIFGLLGGLFSGGANLLGAVVSGLLGAVGTVGGGILSTIATVLRFVPGGFLLGTIALAGVAYLLKKVSENINFSGLTDKILRGLGLDPDDKENSLTKQILKKLGFSEDTAGKIDNTFKDIGQTFSNIFEPVVRTMLIHSRAAFNTLTHSFSILGEEFKYQADKLFNENKGKIFAAIAVGLMGPAALLSPKLAVGVAGLAGAFGYLTRDKTVEELQKEAAEEKRIQGMDLADLIPGRSLRDRPEEAKANKLKEIMGKWERGEKLSLKEEAIVKAELRAMEIQAQIETLNRTAAASQNRRSQLENLPQTLQERYQDEVQKETLKYMQSQALGKPGDEALDALTRPQSSSPSRVTSGMRLSDMAVVTSGYGLRINPVTKMPQYHRGIDIAMPKGTPLYAVVDGKVITVSKDDINGNFIVLKDSKGNEYSYSHLDSSNVTVGQEVKRGDLVAKSGSTGRSTGPHLHFGVKEKGNFREPLLEEVQNAVTQAQKVSQLSIENMDQQRALMFPGEGGGNNIITTNNNYSGGGGAPQQFASATNIDAIELFASRAIG